MITVEAHRIRKSVVLTKKEMLGDLKEIMIEVLKSSIEDAMNGEDAAKDLISDVININKWNNETLINRWCDMCSEMFFENNTEVTDVLFFDDFINLKGERSWVCSRDDWDDIVPEKA